MIVGPEPSKNVLGTARSHSLQILLRQLTPKVPALLRDLPVEVSRAQLFRERDLQSGRPSRESRWSRSQCRQRYRAARAGILSEKDEEHSLDLPTVQSRQAHVKEACICHRYCLVPSSTSLTSRGESKY